MNLHGFFAAEIFMHFQADIAPVNDASKYRSQAKKYVTTDMFFFWKWKFEVNIKDIYQLYVQFSVY